MKKQTDTKKTSTRLLVFLVSLLVFVSVGFFMKGLPIFSELSQTKQADIIKGNKKMESQELEVKKEEKTIDAKDTAVLKTTKGDIKIKLFLKEAPITAGNFKDLVNRGFYNGVVFHRIIPGFVVQGGCPLGTGTGNFVDPETNKTRYVPMEQTKFKHDKAGRVAMARTSNPDSASSQFFIDLAPLPSLNPGGVDPYGYAIFGEVIEGMDVVNKIVKENVPSFPGDDRSSNPAKINSAEMI